MGIQDSQGTAGIVEQVDIQDLVIQVIVEYQDIQEYLDIVDIQVNQDTQVYLVTLVYQVIVDTLEYQDIQEHQGLATQDIVEFQVILDILDIAVILE